MIFTDKAAKEKITSLESRISELESDLATKDAAIESLQADVTSRDQTIAEHVSTIASRDESINTADQLANENAQTITDLTDKLATAEKSAAQIAVEIAASAGIEKPLEIEAGGTTDPIDYLAEAEKLTGAERTEYVAKYSKEIRAQMLK